MTIISKNSIGSFSLKNRLDYSWSQIKKIWTIVVWGNWTERSKKPDILRSGSTEQKIWR
jgi:hypothetical protein